MTAPTVRVLVVDDNPLVGEALAQVIAITPGLESAGLVARADHLAAEAADRRADVVVLDLRMPGRDPLAALTDFAATHPEVRVIASSGEDDEALADAAIAAGAWAFVAKTGGGGPILAAIRRVAAAEQ